MIGQFIDENGTQILVQLEVGRNWTNLVYPISGDNQDAEVQRIFKTLANDEGFFTYMLFGDTTETGFFDGEVMLEGIPASDVTKIRVRVNRKDSDAPIDGLLVFGELFPHLYG